MADKCRHTLGVDQTSVPQPKPFRTKYIPVLKDPHPNTIDY
jgi:hypothetical protein